jgi:hypothetical protein
MFDTQVTIDNHVMSLISGSDENLTSVEEQKGSHVQKKAISLRGEDD